MDPAASPVDSTLSSILRHDSKQTSYKIALLRAINDLVLAFPDFTELPVAIPLRLLAGYWVAYYWPFVAPGSPIFQGPRAFRNGAERNDLSFRPALAALRQHWESDGIGGKPSDGYVLAGEMRLPRKREQYSNTLITAYDQAIKAICDALLQPIKYAGPGEWQLFAPPKPYTELTGLVVALPGTRPEDRCLVVNRPLWETFGQLSLWVEALCIHEWCLFTETVAQARTAERVAEVRAPYLAADRRALSRGDIFTLLTDHPENRRPMTWERHQIQLLLLEGKRFTCPWSHKTIQGAEAHYDLDHIIPLALYPINELWNLVPADPSVNSQVKKARLPSLERMERAQPHLIQTYQIYQEEQTLERVLREDVAARFPLSGVVSASQIASSTQQFVQHLHLSRNIAVF